MPEAPPELSVILVVGSRRDRASRALASLLAQEGIDRMEILLADLDPEGEVIAGIDHPWVRVLPMSPEVVFGEARRRAVVEARAEIVAFLEEHALAEPGWAEAILAAHGTGSWASVGPRVRNGNPGVGLSDIIGLISYGLFYPGEERDEGVLERDVLPGHNSSFRRDVLLGYGADLGHLLMNDNLLFARLRRDGQRLALAPAIKIRHFNEVGLGPLMRAYFHYHRIYGNRRAEILGWSPFRRWIYILLAPAMPVYFLVKFGRHLAGSNRRYLPLLLRHIPSVYLMQLAAGVGQALGLALGVGGSELVFTRCEVEAPRPWRDAGGVLRS
jgi:GT2 family glycosyltransferase